MSDLTLDGNAFAGLLTEALAADPTRATRHCTGCGETYALGAHRAYTGAGVVLRCPGCGGVGLIVGVHETSLTVRLEGTFSVQRAP